MTRSITRWGAASLALSLALATPAFAQGQQLQAGGVVSGEVTGSGAPMNVSLQVAAGQTVQIDAIPAPGAPDGFDLVMKVYDAGGKVVGQDDDSGGGLNP